MSGDQKKAPGAADAPAEPVTDEQLWNEMDEAETAAGRGDDPGADDRPDPLLDAKSPSKDDAGDGDIPDDPEMDSKAAASDKPGATDGDSPDALDAEALKAQNDRLSHALDSEKGRTAAARREIARLQAEVSGAKGKTQRRAEPDDAAREERRKQLDILRDEYPDVAGPLLDRIEEMESRFEDTAREVQQLDSAKARLEDLSVAESAVLLEEHPDAYDVINKDRAKFEAWIDDQPRAIRDAYAANKDIITDGQQAALLVTRFKQSLLSAASGDTGPAKPSTDARPPSRRASQMDGAMTPRTRGQQRVVSDAPPDTDDPQAIWDYWERVERRQGAGRR